MAIAEHFTDLMRRVEALLIYEFEFFATNDNG